MGVYIGVDFHARTQTVCWCDPVDGEIHQRTLDHQRDDMRLDPRGVSTQSKLGRSEPSAARIR